MHYAMLTDVLGIPLVKSEHFLMALALFSHFLLVISNIYSNLCVIKCLSCAMFLAVFAVCNCQSMRYIFSFDGGHCLD